jgi:hypothetical protein
MLSIFSELKTARLLKVSPAKVPQVRRLVAATADPYP